MCINANFWNSLASEASEKRYRGLKKMENRINEIEGKKKDLETKQGEVDSKADEVEKNVESKTSERGRRDYVPTEREMYYLRQANERLPPVVIRGPETTASFKNYAPWVLIHDFDSRNFDHTPFQDNDIPAEKRTLDESMIL